MVLGKTAPNAVLIAGNASPANFIIMSFYAIGGGAGGMGENKPSVYCDMNNLRLSCA